jgi:hypothetical protein
VENWSYEAVFEWAKGVIKEEHAKKLLEQEVKGTCWLVLSLRITGSSLVSSTNVDFERWGIPGGPAKDLYLELQRIASNPSGTFFNTACPKATTNLQLPKYHLQVT